ncbi:MAG: hypothetical protein RR754_05605, partial [Oscillospiraceae bacterium]
GSLLIFALSFMPQEKVTNKIAKAIKRQIKNERKYNRLFLIGAPLKCKFNCLCAVVFIGYGR